jgi:hypothetical protein
VGNVSFATFVALWLAGAIQYVNRDRKPQPRGSVANREALRPPPTDPRASAQSNADHGWLSARPRVENAFDLPSIIGNLLVQKVGGQPRATG